MEQMQLAASQTWVNMRESPRPDARRSPPNSQTVHPDRKTPSGSGHLFDGASKTGSFSSKIPKFKLWDSPRNAPSNEMESPRSFASKLSSRLSGRTDSPRSARIESGQFNSRPASG